MFERGVSMNNKNLFNLTNSDRDYIARNAVFVEKDIKDYRSIYSTSIDTSDDNIILTLFKILGLVFYKILLAAIYFIIVVGGYMLLAKCLGF